MSSRLLSRILSIALLLALTACTLPEVTPPVVDTATPTSSFILTPETSVPTESTPQHAVTITSANVGSLTAGAMVPVINPQLISWSSDSQILTVVNQTSDDSGNSIFGATGLKNPGLETLYIYSSPAERISAVASDGHTAVSISADQMSYHLLKLGDTNPLVDTFNPGYRMANVTFSPDLIYTAVTEAENWEVVLYDFEKGTEVRRLTGFETAAPVFIAGFSDSPQWIVWLARGTVQLQEVETGKLSRVFSHEDFVTALTVSRDGTLMATAAGKTVNGNFVPAVTLWDVVDGVELRTLVLTSPANALSFSSDGKLLAIGVDKDLQVWDVTSGTMLAEFTGHLESIALVKFSPDGKAIATAGYDNQLFLWQVLQ